MEFRTLMGCDLGWMIFTPAGIVIIDNNHPRPFGGTAFPSRKHHTGRNSTQVIRNLFTARGKTTKCSQRQCAREIAMIPGVTDD